MCVMFSLLKYFLYQFNMLPKDFKHFQISQNSISAQSIVLFWSRITSLETVIISLICLMLLVEQILHILSLIIQFFYPKSILNGHHNKKEKSIF